MIVTECLTKKFGELTAVDSLTLHVNDGEVLGFLTGASRDKATPLPYIARSKKFVNSNVARYILSYRWLKK